MDAKLKGLASPQYEGIRLPEVPTRPDGNRDEKARARRAFRTWLQTAGLRCRRRVSARTRGGVLLPEFIDTAGGVHDLLLARIEGVAARAHFDLQVVAQRGTRVEGIAAGAGDGDLFVIGVNRRFHGTLAVEVAGSRSRNGAAPAKGRGTIAAKVRLLKLSRGSRTWGRRGKISTSGAGVSLSTELVDKSVHSDSWRGSISRSYCVFVTLNKK